VDRNERRRRLILYLEMKVEDQDWHGVQDAASDIRDLESELRGIDWAAAQIPKATR
jgi:hypothetical protein